MLRTNDSAAKIARRLEAVMDALRPAAATDAPTAFYALCLACHDAIDELDGLSVPPIAGGAPDDFEELCPSFLNDPAWPAYPDDATADHAGPLPLSVLAETAPTWAPSDQDWNDYAAWCESQGYGVREEDLAAAGLAVG